jgi:hypothetical protein
MSIAAPIQAGEGCRAALKTLPTSARDSCLMRNARVEPTRGADPVRMNCQPTDGRMYLLKLSM